MSPARMTGLRASLAAAGAALVLGSCASGNTLSNARCPCSLTAFAGDGQSARAGTELPAELVVRVLDVDDQPILGVSVLWRVSSGGGVITPQSIGGGLPGESITDPGGFNTASWTLGSEVGDQTVVVTSLISANSVTFTATATAP